MCGPHSVIEIDTGGRPVQDVIQTMPNFHEALVRSIKETQEVLAASMLRTYFTPSPFSDEWLSTYDMALKAARMNRWSGGDS